MAPGRLIVLMRPPSLEPWTPDVCEPREWTMRWSGYRFAAFERGEDGVDRRVVAQPPGVDDQVVVGGVVAVVAVDLLDVRGPVLVGQLDPPLRLVLGGDVEALHDDPGPHCLAGAQEHVQRSGEASANVRPPPPPHPPVPVPAPLLLHLLPHLQTRL